MRTFICILLLNSCGESKIFSHYAHVYLGASLILDNFHKTFVLGDGDCALVGNFSQVGDTIFLCGKEMTDNKMNNVESFNKECLRTIILLKGHKQLRDITASYYGINENSFYDNKWFFPTEYVKVKVPKMKSEKDFFKYQLWVVH
jgi:hypothetical protein